MANGEEEEEERVLEGQLEIQLHEHRQSLSAISHALLSDPTNSELLAVLSLPPSLHICHLYICILCHGRYMCVCIISI